MFDTHKNTLGFNMKYETSYNTMEGWAFIEFIALLIYHKINARLMDSNLIKTFNVKDILFRAATVTQSMSSGSWKVCNLTQPLKDIFKAMGVTIDVIS
jgi:hypothetical protein